MTCEYANQCHGCQSWCDDCGDVTQTCGATDGCYQHRCLLCNGMLSKQEREAAYDFGGFPAWCFSCDIKVAMNQAIALDHDEVAAGEFVAASHMRYR